MAYRGYGYVGAPKFGAGYGTVTAPRFGACAGKKCKGIEFHRKPAFGACGATFGAGSALYSRKFGDDKNYTVIVPCKEFKITNWDAFWESVKELVLAEIELSRQTGDPLSETKIAAAILECVDANNMIMNEYYKLAYSIKYASFVFELNKYILGIFYQQGLISETEAKKRVAGILKNLNIKGF